MVSTTMNLKDETERPVDYYEILQSDRKASVEELKKNYQRLVLTLHPDKNALGCDKSDASFLMLQKAWTVLRDPETRKLYDAELSCKEHSDLLLYANIDLKDMDFLESEECYTYTCRCGGNYILEAGNIDQNKVIIPCDECSFSVEVTCDS